MTRQSSYLKSNFVPEDLGMLLAASAAAYGVGFLSMLVLPFLIGATVDEMGLSNVQAGLLGTVEFLAIMVSAFIAAASIDKLPRRTLAISGTLIAIVGNLLCMVLPAYEFILAMRVLAGLGAGLALAAGNATVSNANDPEKMTGQMSLFFVVLMILTTYVFPYVIGEFGYRGAYGAVAVIMIAMLVLIVRLPQTASEMSVDLTVKTKNAIFSAMGMLVLFGCFLFALRDMMQWSFIERIGVEAGYSGTEIGSLLSTQAFIGLLGPIIAMVIGSRFGLKAPTLLGILATGLVTYLVIKSATTPRLYSVAVMGVAVTYFFALSYLTAFAAQVDRKGRVVAAMGSFMIAGAALAPVSTGYLIDHGGYELIGKFVLIVVALTLIAIAIPLIRNSRSDL